MRGATDAADAVGAPARRPVVLVAEDERSVREMIALVLRGRGYDVLSCEDGRQAITLLDSGARVDVVLLDLRMPYADGAEVLTHVRRHERLSALPVIAMSAYNDERQALEMRSVGADAFLAKPFTVDDLLRAIASALSAS